MKRQIIGPTCSGTSALGKLLAEDFEVPWFDADDILWEKTDTPFTVQKEKMERINILEKIFNENITLVLSGWTAGWGDIITDKLDLVIYKYVEQDIRIKRLYEREKQRHGNRIDPGNDMHEGFKKLEEYIKLYDIGGMDIRSKKRQLHWLNELKCKIIKLEKNIPLIDELKIVKDEMEKLNIIIKR